VDALTEEERDLLYQAYLGELESKSPDAKSVCLGVESSDSCDFSAIKRLVSYGLGTLHNNTFRINKTGYETMSELIRDRKLIEPAKNKKHKRPTGAASV